jgi:hypothetical protein
VDLPFCGFGGGLLATFHVVNTIHWKIPCNRRATHVQHTCNTTCNTTTLPVNLQSKCLSGTFRRPKAISKGKGENFAPSRENHRNLQPKCSCCTSCCTCVARRLHVFSRVFPLGSDKSLAGATFWEPGVELSWQAQDFEWQAQHFRGRRKILSGKPNTFEQ